MEDNYIKKLIITADDFGYSQSRNEGIIECFLKGAVTRSSVMVNAVASKDAFMLARKHGLPLGLHLNLTEGFPIANVADVRSLLIDNTNTFLGKMGFRSAMKDNIVLQKEIRREIEAQIELFKDLNAGCLPLYVDGHQHAHIIPGVYEVFADVLSHYGIPETRLPAENDVVACDWITGELKDLFNSVVEQAHQACAYFHHKDIKFTDSFTGMQTMGDYMTTERLQRAIIQSFTKARVKPTDVSMAAGDPAGNISKKDVQTCELMVHPGYRCPSVAEGGCGDGADDFSMSADRELEMKILCSEDMKQFYKKSSIQLVHSCTAVC